MERQEIWQEKDNPQHTAQANAQSVTIKKGETLSGLARKHGTTVKKLKQLNGIKGSNIRAGKKIRVK